MAQYTYTAFNWSQYGYNATYNTSVSLVIDDDDANLDGGTDSNETASINGGAFGATSGSPYDIDVAFTDTNGDPHVETFYFINTGGSWYFIPGPGSAFTVGATLGSYQSHTTTPTPYTTISCFVRGTLIETDQGPTPVENLRAGSRVLTANGTFKSLRIPMSRKVSGDEVSSNPKLAPVRIVAGALGNGMPKRDLLVSRQHRMLVSSPVCKRMFGQSDALVAAVKLTALHGVFVEPEACAVEYFHLLFDCHEVIIAEGAPTESFFIGPEALKTMSPEARSEISTIFPEIKQAGFIPEPACYIPSGKLQKALIARHLSNKKPLVSAH
ncbi:Hint domain-containing protein [Lentibacter algarum]|uniref:Hint domain-containing protein n=1 Tax=Lentibacter algarum TaxID=576131 RepID=UPI001C0913ED|nr:Hint domain-containing protein [Lentibacter algarum]MBU2983471.1 Hint domain-containing protein [Lentibacter algarum]